MYARRVGDESLTFAVSGLLWNESLVMIDMKTRSLWSHLYGKAMHGPLEGNELERLPATMTDWATWRELHPKTTAVLLSRTAKVYNRDFYGNLADFVLGAVGGKSARAWPFDELIHAPVVNDRLADQPVLVTFQSDSKTAALFSRVVGDRTLSFQMQDGKLVDQETKSVWSPRTGEAISGPLDGSRLTHLPGSVSYREAWHVFYPESTFYGTE